MRVLASIGRLNLRLWRRPPRFFATLALIALVGVTTLTTYRYARAPLLPPPIPVLTPIGSGCFRCSCHSGAIDIVETVVLEEHSATRLHIWLQFELHRTFFVVDYWWRNYVLSAMMFATQQMTAVAMQQMQILGVFFDAKEALELQRTWDILKAEAHRDYHPDTQMCAFGTLNRSLAATQRRGVEAAHVLNQRFLDRQLNSDNTNAGEGKFEDREGRLEQFYARFCGERDNNYAGVDTSGLHGICEDGVQTQNINRDIDYGSLVDMPMTINADLTNTTIGDATERDEAALLALASNLYGHEVVDPPSPSLLEIIPNKPMYVDSRALAAKRSVAVNSFSALVGMKTMGAEQSEDTRGYMRAVLRQMMGDAAADEDILAYLGNRPSYHAQMEMLTKTLYQRPEFYTNLYTTEANIDRSMASMRAISLMQNFDLFKSRLRNEAMLAVLIELELETEQLVIEDEYGAPSATGQEN
jgi:hypothetical protein